MDPYIDNQLIKLIVDSSLGEECQICNKLTDRIKDNIYIVYCGLKDEDGIDYGTLLMCKKCIMDPESVTVFKNLMADILRGITTRAAYIQQIVHKLNKR